ncbi:MAG: YfcE family phosphodiesterase [Coriobacteriia bacterium]|nr:YfcE family phosphodiesterase [Coriobacteriia bacterium]
MSSSIKVGIISDTHGYLPEVASDIFQEHGVSTIVHAGDSESERTLGELELVAPVIAVRGNCDYQPSLQSLPSVAKCAIGNSLIVVAHKPDDLDCALRRLSQQERTAVKYLVGVHGHTHIPRFEEERCNDSVCDESSSDASTIVLCPGSPVEPRSESAPSIAILTIAPADSSLPPQAELVELIA